MAPPESDVAGTTSKSFSDLTSVIASRLNDVRRRILAAAHRAGRDPAEIRLVGVSKTFGIDSVRAAVAAGLIDFGENRVQEALEKIEQTSDTQITWHLVGHLQSNKVRRAAGSFAWIHSIDDVELLRRLDLAAADQQTTPNVLVQVDLAGEATKHGAPIAEVPRIFEAGLTCRAVPYFRQLAGLRESLRAQGIDTSMIRHLSMGMSHDFEVAIEEGATMVRVGTAIFGSRPPRIDA
jgi:pyridoxal phosphate enzyme (YggS family)